MPNTVPNSSSDIATFGASNVTALSITNTNIDLDSAIFNSGAPPYTTTIQTSSLGDSSLTLNGAGILNNSGVMQSFVISSSIASFVTVSFYNTASAGEMTTFSTTTAGSFTFYDSSSAGSAIFNIVCGENGDGDCPGGTNMNFSEGTTAADATINASGGAYVIFNPGSSGGNATFNLTTNAYLQFGGDSNAEHANVNCIGAYGVLVLGTSSAGDGTFTMNPANTSVETANTIYFANGATAGNATFVLDGGMGAGLLSSSLLFFDNATAANANVTAYGGSNGGPGASIEFHKKTDGGTASFALLGNSTLDISKHTAAPATLGSLSGSGTVYLGARTLALGSNNASTTFSGVIQDTGGISHDTGGSLSKVGTGTLILTGTNLYTGATTVSAGVASGQPRRFGDRSGRGQGKRRHARRQRDDRRRRGHGHRRRHRRDFATECRAEPDGKADDSKRYHLPSRWQLQLQTQHEKKQCRPNRDQWHDEID